jgi:hypothetical protein
MEHVDTITLEHQLDGQRWRWRAVSGRTGTGPVEPLGLRAGDRLVVGLRWRRAEWRITRYVQIPEHAWMPAQPSPESPDVTVGGRRLAADAHGAMVRPGDVRPALAYMDPRSTGSRDVGRTAKVRPAIVSWVDHGYAGIHFLYDVDSAVRREGLGRRLVGWKEAGLRKPSVASTEQSVRHLDDLGGLIGRLVSADRAAFGIGGT